MGFNPANRVDGEGERERERGKKEEKEEKIGGTRQEGVEKGETREEREGTRETGGGREREEGEGKTARFLIPATLAGSPVLFECFTTSAG